MNKNIFLFYVLRALFLPYFWVPVLYIYLTAVKGLNPAQTALLLSLQELLLIFLEIPTGVVADKVSRRFSVGLGYILAAAPFLFLPLVSQYWLFILIFSVKAVGKALISGADTSLLYDTLVDLGKTNEYKRILNISKALMMAVVGITTFLGGVIAQYGNIEWTLILPFPLALIGAAAAFLMDEPETSKKAKAIQDRNYLLHTFHSFKDLAKSKAALILILIFAITEATAVNMKWYYTPILEKLDFSLFAMGSAIAFLYLGKFVFFAIGTTLLKDDQNVFNIIFFSGLTGLAFLMPAIFFVTPIVILSLFIVILLTESLVSILLEEIQNNLRSHNRATAMSIVNLSSSIIAVLTLNAFGLIQLSSGVRWAIVFLAGTFGIAYFIAVLWKQMRQTALRPKIQ